MNKFIKIILSTLLVIQPLLLKPLMAAEPSGSNYPAALDDADQLGRYQNNAYTNLDGAINSTVTTVVVDSTNGFPQSGYFQVNGEVIHYESKSSTQFQTCTRGADNTANASHSDNDLVEQTIVAAHLSQLRDAIIAVETELGLDPAGTQTDVVTRLNAMQTDIDAVDSSEITDNEIVNADISTNANIALSKVATATAGYIIVTSTAGVPTYVAMSGDATITSNGTVSLATDFISETELDTEAELEAQLTDVTDVFTNNDGALSDDDLTDDLLTTISNVVTSTETLNDVLLFNGTNWVNDATPAINAQDVTGLTDSNIPDDITISTTSDLHAGADLYVTGTIYGASPVKVEGGLTTNGTITATYFVGDGSNLTGIAGGGGTDIDIYESGSVTTTAIDSINFQSGFDVSGTSISIDLSEVVTGDIQSTTTNVITVTGIRDITVTTASPTNNYVLGYNSTTGQIEWMQQSASGSGSGGGVNATVIDEITLTTATSSITFTAIPQTYDHLIIKYKARSNGTTDDKFSMYYNGDTTYTNYYYGSSEGGNASVDSDLDGAIIGAVVRSTYGAGYFADGVIEINDYTSSTYNNWARSYSAYMLGGSILWTLHLAMYWETTDAITSIQLTMSTDSFDTNSKFVLIGYNDDGTLVDVNATQIQGVDISTTAPTTGQVLTATGTNAAEWKTPSSGEQTVSTYTPSGTTETLDFDVSFYHSIDLDSATGDVTLTLSSPVQGQTYLIKVIQGATARNLTWPASVKWPSGTAPTISTTNNDEDVITLWWDGTSYYGNFQQDYL